MEKMSCLGEKKNERKKAIKGKIPLCLFGRMEESKQKNKENISIQCSLVLF